MAAPPLVSPPVPLMTPVTVLAAELFKVSSVAVARFPAEITLPVTLKLFRAVVPPTAPLNVTSPAPALIVKVRLLVTPSSLTVLLKSTAPPAVVIVTFAVSFTAPVMVTLSPVVVTLPLMLKPFEPVSATTPFAEMSADAPVSRVVEAFRVTVPTVPAVVVMVEVTLIASEATSTLPVVEAEPNASAALKFTTSVLPPPPSMVSEATPVIAELIFTVSFPLSPLSVNVDTKLASTETSVMVSLLLPAVTKMPLENADRGTMTVLVPLPVDPGMVVVEILPGSLTVTVVLPTVIFRVSVPEPVIVSVTASVVIVAKRQRSSSHSATTDETAAARRGGCDHGANDSQADRFKRRFPARRARERLKQREHKSRNQ